MKRDIITKHTIEIVEEEGLDCSFLLKLDGKVIETILALEVENTNDIVYVIEDQYWAYKSLEDILDSYCLMKGDIGWKTAVNEKLAEVAQYLSRYAGVHIYDDVTELILHIAKRELTGRLGKGLIISEHYNDMVDGVMEILT